MKDYTDSELLAIVSDRRGSAINSVDGNLSVSRADIMERYLGDDYGDEKKGLSSVVTREVLETVEWALPSLMKIFAGDDYIVKYDAIDAEDEQAAMQETEFVNHVFRKQNGGFIVLHDFIKDAMLSPTAYSKVTWEDEDITTTERYEGLLPQDLVFLENDPELEAVAVEEQFSENTIDPTTGAPIPIYAVEYTRTKKTGRCLVESVEPETLKIDNKVTGLNLKEADFIELEDTILKTKLVDMGFDRKMVDDLPSDVNSEDNEFGTEQQARKRFTDEDSDDSTIAQVKVSEVYLKLENKKTGGTERRRLFIAGGKILENEQDDYIPFCAMSAIRIPHSHTGIAFAELVVDLQRIKTTLTRQLLNNLYRVNNPRPVVGQGVNLKDVLNDAPNAPIRARDISDIRMEPTTPILNQVLPVLTHFGEVQETRTGVSKFTQGVDASTLAQSTRGAFLGAMENSNQRLEMLARMFAETGIKDIFVKMHELLSRNQTEKIQYKLRGEWTTVNPAEWTERKDMSVVVGIGFSTKEQDMASGEMIKNMQADLAGAGSRIVGDEQAFNLASKIVKLANFGDPEMYFADPKKLPPAEPQPDAELELAKAENAKADVMHQSAMFKKDTEMQQLKLDMGKLIADAENDVRKLDLEEMKVILESQYKDRELDIKEEQVEIQSNNQRTQGKKYGY